MSSCEFAAGHRNTIELTDPLSPHTTPRLGEGEVVLAGTDKGGVVQNAALDSYSYLE